MKAYYSLLFLVGILLVSLFSSCSSDDDSFLKRNLTDLKFDYTESTKVFTIRATGDWHIDVPEDYSWIHVEPSSGKGDGITYQEITVKCDRNKDVDREGVILLSGSGETDVPINVFQLNGLFEWQQAENGRQFTIDKYPIVGKNSEAVIKIPYLKAIGDENFPLEVTLSGKGAEGLSIEESTAKITEEGDGFINIPISGTATKQGLVNVKVKVNNQEFGEEITLAAIGVEVLKQDFNKMPWGGDCIGNKAGVTTTEANANMTLADPTKTCAIGDNGANGSGLTSTILGANPSFIEAIGLKDWLGLRNYMRPGYIQLGAASATGSEFGSIITPGLDIPEGKNYDILVTFKGAKYNNPSPDKLMLGLYPKGAKGINAKNGDLDKISQMVNVPFEIGYQSWGSFSTVIENASNASGLVFSIPEEFYNEATETVQAGRVYIDDIVILY